MERHEQTHSAEAVGEIGTQHIRNTTGASANVKKQLAKTACKHGHPFSDENLYINPHGKRECRTCRRLAHARASGKPPGPNPNFIPMAERTHCPKGHPYSIENTIYNLSPRFRICRTCRKEQDRNRRTHGDFLKGRGKLTADQVRSIAVRLREGDSLHQIVTNNPVCTFLTLKAFRIRNARLWKPLAKLADANRQEKWRATLRARQSLASPAIMKNDGADAFGAICEATSGLPDFIRNDVRSAMFVAAAEGHLKPRDAAKRVREFVTAHYRQNSKFVPGGGIMRSLDEQVYDDGPTRLVDTVTHGLWQ
ncbi:MAG: hypothetical protein WBH00_13105 [Xanthobacteraceae bacterium]